MTGHPACHRVDGEEHRGVSGQHRGQLGRLVLGLRGSQAVAGDDDDLAGVGQLDGGVLGRDAPDAGTRYGRRAAGPAVGPLSPVPKPPIMTPRTERFIAWAMSAVRIPLDAPTSAPPMIRAPLSITMPAIARRCR
jgi:hypothetical protein